MNEENKATQATNTEVPETTGAEANVVHDEPKDPGELQLDDALAEFENVKGELKVNELPEVFTKTEEPETPTEEEPEATPETTEDIPAVEEVEVAVEADEEGIYDTEIVEDPGEFTPGDYGFNITLTDGKTYTVKSAEDADAIAELVDENPELMTAKTLISFNRNVNKMDSGIEADRKNWESKKEAFNSQQEIFAQRDNTITQINNGINYLEDKGLLPPVAKELIGADVKWEDHADEPGIKERLELLKYMSDENARRIKAGLEPSMDIVSAYNGFRLEQTERQKEDADKQVKEDQRKAGSRISGKSRSIPTPQRKGEIIGTGGSLDELLAEYY